MRNKYIIIGVAGVFIVTIIVALVLTMNRPNVNLLSSPKDASILLDGKQTIASGEHHLSVGQHSATAHFDGFADQSITFNVPSSGESTEYLVLIPNSQRGYDWLSAHPDESKNREDYGSQLFSKDQQRRLEKNPIIKDLPYVGPGSEYRVDYGQGSGASSDSITVYITYYVPAGKQKALDWMTRMGYSPTAYTIVYQDKTSQPPITNNPYTN